MSDELQRAISAIQAGDLQGGQEILSQLLKTDPENETAWVWMSTIVTEDVQRIFCLKQVLHINPDNTQARLELGKLTTPAASEAVEAADTNRPAQEAAEPPKFQSDAPTLISGAGLSDIFAAAEEAVKPVSEAAQQAAQEAAAIPLAEAADTNRPAHEAEETSPYPSDAPTLISGAGLSGIFAAAEELAGTARPAQEAPDASGETAAQTDEGEIDFEKLFASFDHAAGQGETGFSAPAVGPADTVRSAHEAVDTFRPADTGFPESTAETAKNGSEPAFVWPFEPEQPDLAEGTAAPPANVVQPADTARPAHEATGELGTDQFDRASYTEDAFSSDMERLFGSEPGAAPEAAPEVADAMQQDEEAFRSVFSTPAAGPDFSAQAGFGIEETDFNAPLPFELEPEEGGATATPQVGADAVRPARIARPADIARLADVIPPTPKAGGAGGAPSGAGSNAVWLNPGGRLNRIVILRDEYLIYAKPEVADLEKIQAEVAEGQVKRKSLGPTARPIKLSTIARVDAPQGKTAKDLDITIQRGPRQRKDKIEFADPQSRDQALDALYARLEELRLGWQKVDTRASILKKLLLPVIALLVVCLGSSIVSYLVASPLYNSLAASAGTIRPADILSAEPTHLILTGAVMCLGGLLTLAALIWLILTLVRPSKMVSLLYAEPLPPAN
jgi:hypothetical protein